MINITIGENGTPSPNMINLGSQFENLDEVIQFTFPSDLEQLNKYVVAKTYDSKKKENITRVTPLVDNRFVIGSAITKVTGTWLLYTLCKSYSADSDNGTIDNIERVSISDPIIASITENDIDIGEIEGTEIDPNIKIIYDELKALKKELEANEATRQANETTRVEAENERLSAETIRDSEEHTRQANEAQRAENETNRASAETARANAEVERARAETSRATAESARREAENERISDEAVRTTNESTRVASESARVQSESLREQAEATRQGNEKKRSDAEKTRIQNEQARTSAETARASAETSRQNSENERVNAEIDRATAESERAEAETTRLNNEQSRVDAEKLRVSAEQARVTAETARAEAEAKRDGTITKLREDVDANTKADGVTQRSLKALWELNKGISYKFEDDSTKAYQKTVPTGAKLGAVNAIGGRTIPYNQMFDYNKTATQEVEGVTFTNNNDGSYTASGTSTGVAFISKSYEFKKGHVYLNRSLTTTGSSTTYKSYITGADMFDSATYQADYGKGAINKALKDGYAHFVPLYVIEGNTVQGLKIVPQLFDLTKMFGSGNEPSTVEEFEKMFPLDYYPYNEGTLMSMGTKDVVEQGKNYFKCKSFSCGFYGSDTAHLSNVYGTSIDSTEPSNKVTVTQTKAENKDAISNYANGVFSVSLEPIKIDKQYIFSFEVTPTNMLISNPYILPITKGLNFKIETLQQGLEVGKKTKLSFEISIGNIELTQIELRIGGISGVFENFQIEEGTTATAFTPYHEQTYTIPKAILDLEGYGWGVGDAYNYVDYEYKKFVKYVGRVDLGTLNFTYGTYGNDNNFYIFKALLPNDIKKDENAYLHTNNLLCSKYADTPWNDLWSNGTDKKITQTSNNINITDSSFTEAEAFKQSLQGVYLYYELAEPVVTDISDIIGDTFQEPFNVEGGGSLTFKNTNGDGYKLAVPSNVQYTIKLNEVTS